MIYTIWKFIRDKWLYQEKLTVYDILGICFIPTIFIYFYVRYRWESSSLRHMLEILDLAYPYLSGRWYEF